MDLSVSNLGIISSPSGILSVCFEEKDASSRADSKQISKQLKEYFLGTRTKFDIKLDLNGTPFQLKVWRALQNIPYGNIASYQDIANKIKQPKAVRAVANAIGVNPIAIIIPCHRVIRSNGTIGGYKWGTPLKTQLLQLEAVGRRDKPCL
jgi:O-6-methylguanine DNA methyltransferase